MTDFETLNQLLHSTELVFAWMSLLATIVFSYITAVFFFLHRAPSFTRVTAYIFFMFSVIFIVGNLVGIYLHILAINVQIDMLAAREGASGLVVATSQGQNKVTTAVGFWSFLPVVLGVLAMAFWMTFLWKPESDRK